MQVKELLGYIPWSSSAGKSLSPYALGAQRGQVSLWCEWLRQDLQSQRRPPKPLSQGTYCRPTLSEATFTAQLLGLQKIILAES